MNNQIKLSDYVVEFIRQQGVDTVFGLQGGAVVHFFDSVAKYNGIKSVFCHHEQAAALAAFSYAKIKNTLGCAIVTTGPGGTNAVTGVLAAYQDSVPCIFVSGQARKEFTTYKSPLRQGAPQELDIVSIVDSITKYAVMIEDPDSIRYHLEKAVYLASHGRPGPVWVDIPVNYQWSQIDLSNQKGFDPAELESNQNDLALRNEEGIFAIEDMLQTCERPLLMVGYGVRLAHAEKEVAAFIERLQIPFISSWTAADIIPTDHPLYLGRPGMMGQRGANIAIQNCDFLLVVGSHLCIPQTGTNFKAFAREAKIAVVDIDELELNHLNVHVDVKVACDAKYFLSHKSFLPLNNLKISTIWKDKFRLYKSYNAAPENNQAVDREISSYAFIDALSDELSGGESIIVDGGGVSLFTSFQAFKIKQDQRLQVSSGMSAMGSGLPEAVGAYFANPDSKVICISGDGSMQLNIQELQTIKHHNLPIKIFVQNNNGYLSIRHTQDGFLGGNHIGSAPDGGVTVPDLIKVANAYGIDGSRIIHYGELRQKIRATLESNGPAICEVPVPFGQTLIPRAGFEQKDDGTFAARPFEDMAPFLDRDKFNEAMIIKHWENK